jgi:hypothetical protein
MRGCPGGVGCPEVVQANYLESLQLDNLDRLAALFEVQYISRFAPLFSERLSRLSRLSSCKNINNLRWTTSESRLSKVSHNKEGW